MSAIFGGSKQKSFNSSTSTSSSSNQAYPFLKGAYGQKSANIFNTAAKDIYGELDGGYSEYRKKTGFDFFEKLGLNQVGGTHSGRGSFQSGAALKALANYENNISKASYNDYLDKLFQQANLGLQGGQLVSGAGGKATSSSSASGTGSGSSNNGFGGFLGSIIGGIAASDRRLKKNIKKVGELDNGLGIYTFDYINDNGPYIGVMADEVKDIMPEALGPVVDGYMTVDYSKIKGLK